MHDVRVCLGVVQGWDPEYDMSLGMGMGMRQRASLDPYLRQQNDRSSPDNFTTSEREIINIVVCVTQSPLPSTSDCGWFSPANSISPGERFTITSIRNTTTYLRECQSLISLLHFNKSFRNLILNPKQVIRTPHPVYGLFKCNIFKSLFKC
jgi:hypothetical protein